MNGGADNAMKSGNLVNAAKHKQDSVRFAQLTANAPGAIAIIQLFGEGDKLLRELTGIANWPIGRMRLVNFADIDEGFAVRLDEGVAQLTPHGGPRVMQRLASKLIDLGAVPQLIDEIDPILLYPEASDQYEAIMLRALARAASPLAIDLLLDQPRRWREDASELTAEDVARSSRLNRLIDPPLVVLAGPPNVGKSTLSNALLGRAMSITADMPGTTRDYTAGRIDLSGLVVTWHDTPGLRETSDPIEARAIALAARLIRSADLLIAMTDHEHDWPTLPREPNLRVVNKIDLARESFTNRAADIHISATTGRNIDQLVRRVRDSLVPPSDLASPDRWMFDPSLSNRS